MVDFSRFFAYFSHATRLLHLNLSDYSRSWGDRSDSVIKNGGQIPDWVATAVQRSKISEGQFPKVIFFHSKVIICLENYQKWLNITLLRSSDRKKSTKTRFSGISNFQPIFLNAIILRENFSFFDCNMLFSSPVSIGFSKFIILVYNLPYFWRKLSEIALKFWFFDFVSD